MRIHANKCSVYDLANHFWRLRHLLAWGEERESPMSTLSLVVLNFLWMAICSMKIAKFMCHVDAFSMIWSWELWSTWNRWSKSTSLCGNRCFLNEDKLRITKHLKSMYDVDNFAKKSSHRCVWCFWILWTCIFLSDITTFCPLSDQPKYPFDLDGQMNFEGTWLESISMYVWLLDENYSDLLTESQPTGEIRSNFIRLVLYHVNYEVD